MLPVRKLLAGAVFVSALALAGSGLAQSRGEPSSAEATAQRLIGERIAAFRAEFAPDTPPLVSDPDLVRIARARSSALASGAPFSHQDFEGRYPAIEMVKARFGPYGYIGENIAMETNASRAFNAEAFARRTVDGWMASEEHRDNILSPDYTRTGIGVVIFRDRAYATQIFRGPPPPAKRRQPLRPRGPGGAWSANPF